MLWRGGAAAAFLHDWNSSWAQNRRSRASSEEILGGSDLLPFAEQVHLVVLRRFEHSDVVEQRLTAFQ